MRSYYSIVLHNIKDFLDVKFNFFFRSMGLDYRRELNEYDGDEIIKLDHYESKGSDNKEFFEKSQGTLFIWKNMKLRSILSDIMSDIILFWRELHRGAGVTAFRNLTCIFIMMIVICYEAGLNFIEKRASCPFYLIFIVSLLATILAIILFMPEGRPTYLYASLYSGAVILGCYFTGVGKNQEKTG